ncbi:MAG: hypothetical protein SCK70_15300 [bacterium]|nr:hypothetical protein [bacterium]
MKGIMLKLTEDQIELLENLSSMAGKSSADFIKETMFTLLPFTEYSAVKKYLKSANKNSNKKGVSGSRYINNIIDNIHKSANTRLKRLGVL